MGLIDLVNSYNMSLSSDLTQIVNFPPCIPYCDSHGPALLDFFLSSDTSISSTMAFPPLGNSDHVVVSVSIDFSRFIAWLYNNSCTDWDGLHDHLRDIPRYWVSLNSVLLLLLVNFMGGFRLELMYISFILHMRPNLTHLHGFQQQVQTG